MKRGSIFYDSAVGMVLFILFIYMIIFIGSIKIGGTIRQKGLKAIISELWEGKK